MSVFFTDVPFDQLLDMVSNGESLLFSFASVFFVLPYNRNISHNIKITCLILRKSPFTPLTHWGLDKRIPVAVLCCLSVGQLHRILWVSSVAQRGLCGSACSCTSLRCLIVLGSGEFGCWLNTSGCLLHSSSHSLAGLCGRTHCPVGVRHCCSELLLLWGCVLLCIFSVFK